MAMNSPPFPPVAVVRRATADDAAALSKIAAATFVETFGPYPPEDLQAYLTTAYAFDKCLVQLSNPSVGVWFALIDEEPAGFVVAGGCKLPVEGLEPGAGEIQQLYVYARYHNLGLGSRLMDIALDWLGSTGRDPLYVGVWSENDGAQRLYARYGFSRCGEYGFPVGKTIDREFILRRAQPRAAVDS